MWLIGCDKLKFIVSTVNFGGDALCKLALGHLKYQFLDSVQIEAFND